MQLVLNTYGLVLKVKEKVFYVTDGKEHRKISPEQISSIAITSPCLMSSAAVVLAAEAGIPLYFFDRTGEAQSALRSPWFESLATLRRKQVYFSDSIAGGEWVLQQFRDKTLHQIALLKYLSNRKKIHKIYLQKTMLHLSDGMQKLEGRASIPNAKWNAALMGWEGQQAKQYWQAMSKALPNEWAFKKRSRRPAKNAFNALINYGYGMLYSKTEQALFAAGLDPHLGILHADEYDRPTLSYDLIEPFRPWLDRLIIESIIGVKVTTDYFETIEKGIYLNNNGKRWLIPRFNEWLQQPVRWQKKQLTREAHIFHRAAMLAKTINTTMHRPQ